jgi:hypothetical protein
MNSTSSLGEGHGLGTGLESGQVRLLGCCSTGKALRCLFGSESTIILDDEHSLDADPGQHL